MDPIELIQQGKVKRFFRATRKITAPMVISHLTQRAAGKEPLFIEEEDYLFMLEGLKDISKKRGVAIFAFCLMPNHVHLLVRPEADDLAEAMRDLFARFATRFNKKYERKGHLFGGPYRQAVCLDEGYLLAVSLYIHNNPVRAGLSSSAKDYRWSSASLYCNENPPPSFVSQDFVLNMLRGGKSGAAVYRRMLDSSKGIDTGHVFEQPDALDRFRVRIAKLFPKMFIGFRSMRKVVNMNLLDPEELEQRIEQEKRSRIGGRPRTTEATCFLVEQLLARGFARTEIAERLGICRKTIYNLTKKRKAQFAGHR
jgi:REP-associated tyrosine transposase